jgi:hypothetical protein
MAAHREHREREKVASRSSVKTGLKYPDEDYYTVIYCAKNEPVYVHLPIYHSFARRREQGIVAFSSSILIFSRICIHGPRREMFFI